MKGVSPRENEAVSPKTPGGISKSLLTPCRRVGLSKKWRKSSCSPFISPLTAQNSAAEGNEEKEAKKRKRCEKNEVSEETKYSVIHNEQINEFNSNTNKGHCSNTTSDIVTTPCRNTKLLRKNSKALTLSLKDNRERAKEETVSDNIMPIKTPKANETDISKDKYKKTDLCATNNSELINNKVLQPVQQHSVENVSKPVRMESKSKYKMSLKKTLSKSNCTNENKEAMCINAEEIPKSKERSPNNLTKECIVVIQNNLFNKDTTKIIDSKAVVDSQQSDSELDVPLSVLKKESSEKVTLNTLNDDDFICKPVKRKSRNLSIIKPSKTKLIPVEPQNDSLSSHDYIDKRTILIKKTYNKLTRPSKSKSTGSITQKDIDELKARIEVKKNLLMAKAMSPDTEELRGLIKKWQKGCQDALMELLELMKKKLPDQQNMDYSEMLQALKIPAELVGYDSENDCFVTPDDTNVLLSTFKF